MSKSMNEKLLSIVCLSYYSSKRLRRCYEALRHLLDEERIPFEFIIMDDGSTDDSYAQACVLESEYDNVKAYCLSKNFGAHYSLFAGLSKCSGACALSIPDDEQLPYTTIVEMYRKWENGNELVVPYRSQRDDSILSTFFSNVYYKLMNAFSDVHYPMGGADQFLIDREILDIVNKRIHPINTSVVAEVLRMGFAPCYVPYHRPLGLNRHTSRWTFRKKLRLAKDTFFSASTFPIQLISYFGAGCFCCSVAMGSFYFYIAIWGNMRFWNISVPGWTSLVVLILALGGVILLSLSIIAEYIWRIYDEVKDRPGYIIRKKEDEH